MPGKVNPTQSEAMTMVCVQVLGNDATIGIAGSQGNFELNVFKPVMIFNFLHSVDLLADACDSFREFAIEGVQANEERIGSTSRTRSCSSPRSTRTSATTTPRPSPSTPTRTRPRCRDAAVGLGHLTGEEFDRLVEPEKMTSPGE